MCNLYLSSPAIGTLHGRAKIRLIGVDTAYVVGICMEQLGLRERNLILEVMHKGFNMSLRRGFQRSSFWMVIRFESSCQFMKYSKH